MIILLSPSKQMQISDDNLSDFVSKPMFGSEARKIMRAVLETEVYELSSILNSGVDIARNALKMAYDFFSKDTKEFCSVLLFNGVAFKELNPLKWDNNDKKYAQNNLRIGSGVYGLLRPYDLIRPYRLDLGCKILLDGKIIKLQNYWKQLVTRSLLSDLNKGDNILLNCSSSETFEAIDLPLLKGVRIINARFLTKTNNGLKSAPTVFVKKARGALADFAIRRRVETIDEFENFHSVNMHFCHDLSDTNNAIFIYEA